MDYFNLSGGFGFRSSHSYHAEKETLLSKTIKSNCHACVTALMKNSCRYPLWLSQEEAISEVMNTAAEHGYNNSLESAIKMGAKVNSIYDEDKPLPPRQS